MRIGTRFVIVVQGFFDITNVIGLTSAHVPIELGIIGFGFFFD